MSTYKSHTNVMRSHVKYGWHMGVYTSDIRMTYEWHADDIRGTLASHTDDIRLHTSPIPMALKY